MYPQPRDSRTSCLLHIYTQGHHTARACLLEWYVIQQNTCK